MKNHIAKTHNELISESVTSKKEYIVVRANQKLNIAKMFKCCKCDYSAKIRLSIKKHLEKHRSDGFRVLTCSKCDFTTQELGDYRYHKREHRLRKICSKCDFSTNILLEYKIHRKLHRKGKNIEPPQCDIKAYDDSLTLFDEESALKNSGPIISLENLTLESVQSIKSAEEMAKSLMKMNQIADALKHFKEPKPINVSFEGTKKESMEPNEVNPLEETMISGELLKGETRRPRFSVEQVGMLESIYQRNNFPRKEMKKTAALRTGLTLAKVQSILF